MSSAHPASLAIQAGANSRHSAGLTLDRYRHLYGSGVEAVGVAINALFTRDCDQTWSFEVSELRFSLVEPRGLEPLTPALQRQCSTN